MGGLTLESMLEIALRERDCHRKSYNQQRFGLAAQRYCFAISRRRCQGLPEDLHDEIFHEAFVKLFALDVEKMAAKPGKALFRDCIFAAIRTIKATYAAPGAPTRISKTKPAKRKVAAEHIGELVDAGRLAHCQVGEGDAASVDFDRLPSAAAAAEIKAVEDRFDVKRLLAATDPKISNALYLICVDGERVDHVAAAIGMNRFTLNRRFAALTANWRTAA
jgi:hypothetical protein